MYLNASTDKLELILAGNITTNQLQWNVSYQDITSSGMTLPQSGGAGNSNNTTSVDIISAPSASTTRQVIQINVFNADTVNSTVTIRKDVSASEYVLVKSLLAPNDTLHWSRETGWIILKQSSQESVILTEFTSNGTWTKQAGLKRILAFCIGAGGGGGSGRRGAAGTNRCGGSGGGGGAIVWRNIAAVDLGSSVSVTIGSSGTGGTGQTVDDNNGNNGNVGGDTSFGSLLIAKGGSNGIGGTNATSSSGGTGGASSACNPSFSPFATSGNSGGSGAVATAGTGSTSGATTISGGPGGAGGGGINTSNVSSTSGASGGGVYQNGVLIAGGASATDGLNNQMTTLLFSSTLLSTNGIGTGAGSGFPANVNGRNGGNYGAGGGGGSGVLNGTTSGAGGNGGAGLCIVMEIY